MPTAYGRPLRMAAHVPRRKPRMNKPTTPARQRDAVIRPAGPICSTGFNSTVIDVAGRFDGVMGDVLRFAEPLPPVIGRLIGCVRFGLHLRPYFGQTEPLGKLGLVLIGNVFIFFLNFRTDSELGIDASLRCNADMAEYKYRDLADTNAEFLPHRPTATGSRPMR